MMTEPEAGSQAADFALRNRLLALRDDTLRRFVALDHIDGGLLRLLGDANLALAALDRQPSADAALTARAVVSDDGCEIRLTLYAENGAAFAAPIAPGRLIGGDRSAERQARALAQRLARYRPMPGETSPDRILMRKIIDI